MSISVENAAASGQLVDRIMRRSFDCRGASLSIGDLTISDFAAQFGTPLFVYNLNTASRQWRRLCEAVPEPIDVYYSVKANPNSSVVRHFLREGAGFEVASARELELAMKTGCAANRIIFAGPGKTDDELRLAIKNRIGAIHAESMNELQRIAAVALQMETRAAVAIRVNPIASVQGGAMRMGGKASPFGIDEEQLDDAVDLAIRSQSLDWQGLHFYNGTQILDAAILHRQYEHAIQVAQRVANRTRRPIRSLDFGGGLGVPYTDNEIDLDLVELDTRISEIVAEARRHPAFQETQWIMEPGRFLIAEAGLYVARVLDVKQSRGKKFVIVDGGMHHHLAASGNLGQTIKKNYPIAVVNKINQPSTELVDVVGCLCTPLDTLGRNVLLPPIEPGDLIGIFQSGAYGLTASPQGFLSHPPPAEVCVLGEQIV